MCMQEEIVMETSKKGPGEKLKHARESFGLTIFDIANQLYLPHHVLLALEENDYHAQLPARAFIRGYLRSYSKLLNLSPEEILSDFDALGVYKNPQEENVKSLAQPRVSLTIHKDKFWFSVVGGGLLGVLLLIAGFTWLNTRQEKNDDLINQTLQEDEKTAVPDISMGEQTKSDIIGVTVAELPLNETADSLASQHSQKTEASVPNLEIASSQTTIQITEPKTRVMPEAQVKTQVELTTLSETSSPVAEVMLTPVDEPLPMAQLEVQ